MYVILKPQPLEEIKIVLPEKNKARSDWVIGPSERMSGQKL